MEHVEIDDVFRDFGKREKYSGVAVKTRLREFLQMPSGKYFHFMHRTNVECFDEIFSH